MHSLVMQSWKHKLEMQLHMHIVGYLSVDIKGDWNNGHVIKDYIQKICKENKPVKPTNHSVNLNTILNQFH